MLPTPRRCRPAAAAVEFAVLAPILVMLMFGIWELGRMMQVSQILGNAAREGARQAASGTRTNAEVQDYVTSYIRETDLGVYRTVGGVTTKVLVTPTVTVTNLTDSSRSDPSSANQNDVFRVTVSVPVTHFQWVSARFYNSTSLTASATWSCLADQPVPTPSETIPN
jgi:Flp pilus assembly protein TadG